MRIRHKESKTRCEVVFVPYYHARLNYSNGKRHGDARWQKDHWKARDAHERERTITIPSCSEGRVTKRIESLRKFMDGQKIIVGTWTTSRRSTSPTAHPGTSGTGAKTPSCWYPMMISKLDRCERNKISSPPRTISQGRQNAYIPKNERALQRPFNEALRADLEWHSQNWRSHWSQTSSSSSSQQWCQHDHRDA